MFPPEIARLGHVALVSPDVERSVWFWRDVVGLEEVERVEGSVFLRAWGDFEHHTLSLREGPVALVDHLGWRTRRREDVGGFAELLAAAGVELEWVEAGVERGQGEAVRFATPAGHRFELYFEVEKPLPPEGRRARLKSNSFRAWDHGVSPRRIDHANVTTAASGVRELCSWLSDVLGFRMRELIELADGSLAGGWLSVNNLVHDIAVMGNPTGPSDRLHHLAYYLDNWQDVLRAADIFREQGVEVDAGPGKHGISQAIFLYVKDPGSGHRLELFSGGYLILDPDWEPIVWTEEELASSLTWWGPAVDKSEAMGMTTPF